MRQPCTLPIYLIDCIRTRLEITSAGKQGMCGKRGEYVRKAQTTNGKACPALSNGSGRGRHGVNSLALLSSARALSKLPMLRYTSALAL